jgi:hypothetical protein
MIEVLLKEESNYRSDMTHGNKTDKQKPKVNKGAKRYQRGNQNP